MEPFARHFTGATSCSNNKRTLLKNNHAERSKALRANEWTQRFLHDKEDRLKLSNSRYAPRCKRVSVSPRGGSSDPAGVIETSGALGNFWRLKAMWNRWLIPTPRKMPASKPACGNAGEHKQSREKALWLSEHGSAMGHWGAESAAHALGTIRCRSLSVSPPFFTYFLSPSLATPLLSSNQN